jgi:hypothetical protein
MLVCNRSGIKSTTGVEAVAVGAYISLKGTLCTCTKSNLQRNRMDGVKSVAVCVLCFNVRLIINEDVTRKIRPRELSSHECFAWTKVWRLTFL